MTKKALLLASTVSLCASAGMAAELNMICSADIVICEKMVEEFQANSDININMVRLSSGEAYAKLRAEARNPQTDIWWAGSGDPHLQAAEDELTLAYESPQLSALNDWAVAQAKTANYRTVGIYSGVLGWGYNTDTFTDKGITPPKCWADLLDPALVGEVQIADPNSSGTAYTALATLVQLMGEDEAFAFLAEMDKNVSQYTKSGSAPVKAAARNEAGLGIVFMHDAITQAEQGFPIAVVAPCEGTGYEVGSMSIIEGAINEAEAKVFYDWALSAEAQSLMPDAGSYQIPSNKMAKASDKSPKLEDVKLIDYDFAKYGGSETRQHLLERWSREIGSAQ